MPTITQKSNINAAQWSTAYVNSLPDSSFAFIGSDGERHLPFKDANGKVDLPHTRNALARINQVESMSDEQRNTVRTKLQGALTSTKASNDVMLQAINPIQADATTQELPSRMMLLRAGTFHTQKYGEVPLSADDIREMNDNYHSGIGMAGDGATGIPVDYSHESHKNAGAWIKDMAVENGDELWATDIEFSDSGKKAILGKEYKMLSADFYPAAFGEWVDPESGITAKNVIVGAAFTNRPMFTGNQPVIASEASDDEGNRQKTIYVIASQEKETSMNVDELRVKAPKELNGEEYKFLADNKSELSASEQEKFGLQAATGGEEDDDASKKTPVQASSLKGNEGVVAVQASDIKAMNDKITALQASELKRETETLGAVVDTHIARGAIKADRKDSYVNRLVAASEEDRSELLADLDALSNNPALAAEQGSDKTAGDAQADAEAEVMKKAEDKVKASSEAGKPIDLYTARKQVMAEDPTLAERATGQIRAGLESKGQISKVSA